jgi:hypothetical protein
MGRLLLDGLFDGEHCFRMEALSAHSTRFTESIFRGYSLA